MVMASTVHLELFWQGSSSYGNDGEITEVDFKIGNVAEEISAHLSRSAPSQLEQKLIFNVHTKGWLPIRTDSLECRPDLLHLMQVTARVMQKDDTQKTLQVVLDEIPHFKYDGTTYQMRLRVQGNAIRATIDRKVNALALGSVGGSLLRMGKIFQAASIPNPELANAATTDLQRRLESACTRYHEVKARLQDISLEGNQSFLAIVNNRKLELEVEIVGLRMALEKRREHGL